MRELIERKIKESEEGDNRKYFRRGMITDWRYEIGGTAAGKHLRDGSGKLTRSGDLVHFKIEGRKGMKRVSAALVKGIQPKFWEKPEMARKGNPFY